MIHNNKLFIVLLFTSVLSIGSVSILLNTVKAQEGQSFSAALSGNEEVPPTESNSTGTAKFQETKNNDNESQVSYWVNITGIKEVNEAHIHNGTTGENGDIVATLSNGDSAEGDDRPPQIGFAGNITSNELQGPLEDKEISDLLSLMSDGNAYVNVHTDKYPDGAIRGQVTSTTASTDAGTGTNATTASTDTGADTNATSGNTTSDGQQESTSSQSTDSPNMDVE
jgi:CHRD domain